MCKNIIFFVLLSLTGCTLFSPVTQKELPLNSLPWNSCGAEVTYTVEVINSQTGSRQMCTVYPGEPCILTLEKTGFSFLRIFPTGLSEPFSPLPVGGVFDPQGCLAAGSRRFGEGHCKR